ncbi:MAG: DEAD/DEAH box helicase [Bacteroidales bacterium]|nr:DEAD/DEAH box helicase [Bacteroidales bacterium]
MTFDTMGFSPELLKGIEDLNFENPTPIQEKVIPIVLSSNRDIVGLAQTGTGKTAAFGLPIIEQIDLRNKFVQALILAPTRELCIQISKDLQSFSKHINGLQVTAVYGGAPIVNQVKALKKGTHIIAATPGRILDLIKRKAARINHIKTVILDEADEMLNMGFRDDLDAILETTPAEKRTLLFSATMPKEVARIAKTYMKNPEEITVGKQNAGAENVRHIFYHVHAHNRYPALKRIADYNPDIYGIVFCRTRQETKDVADKLIKDGYNADAIHGDLSQAQRDHVMKRFREKSLQMLVATDVAARGIDVDDITHIINYNLPDELEIYTHRSGRTGRAGKSGISIAIVNFREITKIPQIERKIGKKFEKLLVPSGTEICKKQLFNLIDRMEKVKIDEKQISPFMETVNKKLEWLSKEDIIKHFLSLEFNRFLAYYKNAPDLNEKPNNRKDRRDDSDKRDRWGRQDSRSKRNNENKRKRGNNNYQRFFINLGKKDGVLPTNIIGMINDYTRDRDISIGDIDIKDKFSFFEVDGIYTSNILEAFKNSKFRGRHINVEIAEAPNEGGNRKKKRKKR